MKAEVACMLAAAEAKRMSKEDEIFGKDKRGDEMPDWASDKEKRLAKIQGGDGGAGGRRQAGRGGRAPHRGHEKQQQRNAEDRKKPERTGGTTTGRTTDPKAQRNFTDPDSRIMKPKEEKASSKPITHRQPSTQRPRSLSRGGS